MKPRSQRTESGEAGVTLVELLIALALLAVMTGYALAALTRMRDIDRLIERIEAQAAVDAVARHMRQTIADTRAIARYPERPEQRTGFTGKSDAIEFVSALNDELETGGLFDLRYATDGSGTLRLGRRLVNGGADTDLALLDSVNSIRFRYWGALEQGGEADWRHSWTIPDRLPLAVEITVNFANGDARRWPMTIIPIEAAR